jgi:hypothetical protein
MRWILNLDILLLISGVLQENMESCQNHFWGALNTPPPKKKIIFFQEQEISWEREFLASQIGDYKKMFLIVHTYLGGNLYVPPFNPPNPVSSWRNVC